MVTAVSRSALPVFVACLIATSCGSSSSSSPASSSPAPSSTATPSTGVPVSTVSTSPPADPSVTDKASVGPARARLDWILGLVNGPPPDQATVEAGFSEEFLEAVPYEQILAAAGVFGGATDWTVAEDRLDAIGGDAIVRGSTGAEVTVTLTVDAAEPHLITGLRFVPVVPEAFGADEVVTGEAIAERLATYGLGGFGVFDVSDGSCRQVAGDGVDRVLPLGSAFKLWVLGALALEVEAGRAAWDEPFAVSDDMKSSEDGQVSALADGSSITLREYAEAMISVSDNSATDHLMARVGREQVEAAMAAAGVLDPAANIPMLSTRELFLLKWSDAGLLAVDVSEYLSLDAAGRRAVLDGELAGVALADAIAPEFRPTAPTAIDSVEWFASPADLCRTHVWLAELAGRPGLEPVADILRLNPGVPFGEPWTDVRFKGGSEPGVVFGAWRIADTTGRAFVIAGGVADRDRLVDDVGAIVTLAAATRLPELAVS